jgi:REP element-mobilizing transposase RayT
MKKKRADSKLKNLQDDIQRQILQWCRKPNDVDASGKAIPLTGGLAFARKQLASSGISVSLDTLSRFYRWRVLFEEERAATKALCDAAVNSAEAEAVLLQSVRKPRTARVQALLKNLSEEKQVEIEQWCGKANDVVDGRAVPGSGGFSFALSRLNEMGLSVSKDTLSKFLRWRELQSGKRTVAVVDGRVWISPKGKCNARLRALPANLQRQIIEWCNHPSTFDVDRNPVPLTGGFRYAQEKLKEMGLIATLEALSAFLKAWELSEGTRTFSVVDGKVKIDAKLPPNSRLRSFPEEQQRQIAEWCTKPLEVEDGRIIPKSGGLAYAQAQLRAIGVAVSLDTLSRFRARWAKRQKLPRAAMLQEACTPPAAAL